MPCAKGKELRNFQTDPPEITVLPGNADGQLAAPSCKGGKGSEEHGDTGQGKAGDGSGDRATTRNENSSTRA